MLMRRRGPGLVRTVAATAVVAGTAGAVRHHQEQKWANKAAEQETEQQAAYEAGIAASQPAMPAAAPAPAPAGDDMMTKIQQLAQLHSAGVLTDEEFAAAKAKLLG